MTKFVRSCVAALIVGATALFIVALNLGALALAVWVVVQVLRALGVLPAA